MIPGSKMIYKCTKCDSYISKGSLMSGNTFGASLYSDGKQVAPMLPQFPNLVKCKKCGSFLWLNRMDTLSEIDGSLQQKENSIKDTPAQFLSIDEYFEVLVSSACKDKEDELFVRISIWQAYNDRHRDGEAMFRNNFDEVLWKQNSYALLDLFAKDNINHQIMKADINRNLGEFEKCMNIINELDKENLNWIKEAFKQECEEKNKRVFRLT